MSHFPWKSPQALLSEGRLAATTSRQRRPSLSRDARSHLPAKEEATGTAEAVHRGRDITWTGTKPVTTFVVARAASQHLGGYRPPKQTSPHCRAGQIADAIWKGLRPSHRRGFRRAIYSWHSPTLANLKHLADRRGRANNARIASTRHRELIPGLARASLFSRRHRFSSHVGTRNDPRIGMSTHPPPGRPQFPVAH